MKPDAGQLQLSGEHLDERIDESVQRRAVEGDDHDGVPDLDADLSYRRELWANVPPANRATTAILHLPNQKHNMSQAVLTALLPQAVALAPSALAATARPDGRGLPQGEPLVIVSADTAPEGVLLCGELEEPPPPPPPPPPPVWAGCVQRCFGTLST